MELCSCASATLVLVFITKKSIKTYVSILKPSSGESKPTAQYLWANEQLSNVSTSLPCILRDFCVFPACAGKCANIFLKRNELKYQYVKKLCHWQLKNCDEVGRWRKRLRAYAACVYPTLNHLLHRQAVNA